MNYYFIHHSSIFEKRHRNIIDTFTHLYIYGTYQVSCLGAMKNVPINGLGHVT